MNAQPPLGRIHAITVAPKRNRHRFRDIADMASYILGPSWFAAFGEVLVLDVQDSVVALANSRAGLSYTRTDDMDIGGPGPAWQMQLPTGETVDDLNPRIVILCETVAREGRRRGVHEEAIRRLGAERR